MKKFNCQQISRKTASLKDSAGFTLIELMVVVAILAILVTAAVATFDIATEKQRIASCNTNLDTIRIAINRAAAVYEKPLNQINDADVNQFITGGIGALQCDARKNPQASYHVVNGVISPAHNHK